MSCSEFVKHGNEVNKSDKLVIIINGNGTLTVDSNILEYVLNNNCRATVSVMRKLKDFDDKPDSPKVIVREKNEKSSNESDMFGHEVNLAVEDYYPLPPSNSNNKNMASDSIVSSTVDTPPSPQTSSELFDLLAEGLEIPVPQSHVQTSLEGCIGDSLIDAFTEIASEQLEQVGTALQSEKAEQILRDGASSVLDTLKMVDDTDEWIHFDHSYTVNGQDDQILEEIEDIEAEEIIVSLSDTLSNSDSCREESIDSEASDFPEKNDDPNKLWCICNKPHNNRFMICCDACDNWFHGYCVGITQAMGGKMERECTEWLCPNCKKEKTVTVHDSKQHNRSTTKRHSSQSDSIISNCSTSTTEVFSPLQQSPSSKRSSVNQAAAVVNRHELSSLPLPISSYIQLCSVCKENETMPEGFYCGNDCIVRYVTASIERMNRSYAEPLLEDQKIIVVDRKKKHTITGMRAPSISELPRWLADHPCFEIVKPSAFPIRPGRDLKISPKPFTIEPLKTIVRTKDPQIAFTNKPKSTPTIRKKSKNNVMEPFKKVKVANDVFVREGSTLKAGRMREDFLGKDKERRRPIKLIPAQPLLKSVEETRPNAVPITLKTSSTSRPATLTLATKLSPPVEKNAVKRKSEPPTKDKLSKKPGDIKRPNLKKSDDNATSSRAPTQSNMTARERIRTSCRLALIELFISRMKGMNDINVRKDELTTLANQVENDLFNLFHDTNAKYKSKYRSLRFNIKDEKNTLFRRVAERSLTPYDLVRLTPEEMASAELAQWREREAKHEIDMIKKTELENLNQPKILVLKTHKGELEIESRALPSTSDTVVPDLQPDELSIEADKSKKLSKSSFKDKDVSKDYDIDHDRKKKYESSSSSRKHRHRSSERKRKQHRSRSQRRSKERDDRDRRKSSEKKDHCSSRRSADKKHDNKSSSYKDRHRSRHRSRSRCRRHKENSLEMKKEVSTIAVRVSEAPRNELAIEMSEKDEYHPGDVHVSDMEPTSTVVIQTPPYAASPKLPSIVWTGTLIMPDVPVKLHARMNNVSGRCEGLDEDLSAVVDCVGRISPQTVWEYISKLKKGSSREILVLRLEPVDDEQRANYFTLYAYLNRKDRAAVIGSKSPSMKDFYVIPLSSHSPIPQVLLPFDGPGLEDSRSPMLLGIIVRSRRPNYTAVSLQSLHSSTKPERKSFAQTPVSCVTESRTTSLSQQPTPVFEEDLEKSPRGTVPGGESYPSVQEIDTSLDLQREIEALNRQINEQKQQIENISSSLPQEETPKFYCPKDHLQGKSEKSNVQLPGELQQLLNSLNRRSSEAKPDSILDVKNTEDRPGRGENKDETLQICFSPSDEVSPESSINNKAHFPANWDEDLRLRIPSTYSAVAVSESRIPALSPVSIAPYMYGTSSFITGFPPANQMPTVPPIYASGIFSPATTLPFTPIQPQQLYIPPSTVLSGAPAMIPSVVGSNEMNSALKRKSLEDERDDDSNWSCGKIRKQDRGSKSPPGS